MISTGAIGASGLGTGRALAQQNSESDEIKRHLRSFDPSNPKEVEKAVGYLFQIDSQDKAKEIFNGISSKRKEAIKQAIRNGRGFEIQFEETIAD